MLQKWDRTVTGPQGETNMLRTFAVALAASALTAGAACATAQVTTVTHASQAAHSHAHADFQSGRIHVRVDGPEGAPDIVLIPGLSSSPRIWQETTDHLVPNYRVHRIHVQGFGGAEPAENAQTTDEPQPFIVPVADEIARYIREAGLEKPAVIGHSLGGSLAMSIGARYPDAVSKVMVVDMLPFMGAMFGPPGTTAESVRPAAHSVWKFQVEAPRETYDATAETTIASMINTESRRAEAISDVKGSDQRVAAAAYYDLIVTDMRPDLPRITVPMTVLYVKFNDARMTNEITDRIYSVSFSSRPGTVLKRIDDSAHFIMFDQPAVFLTEIDTFLKSN